MVQRVSRQVLSERLASIVGKKNLLTSKKDLKDYSTDMANFTGTPLLVARPKNENEVSAIMKLANKLRIPVIPRGGGSSLTGAVVGDKALILDTARFNRILKVDDVNWYARVEAGVVLDDLNDELRKEGLFFPPDPASSFLCTVGGAIAEGAGGLRCVRYGTFKDWVLALKVVLPNGNIVKLGEALPKNRAGYDLVHLFVGSEGTLGIITEAWLKIVPLPTAQPRRLLALFADWGDAGKAIQRLRESKVLPTLMEFLDRDSLACVNKAMGLNLPEDEAVLLLDIEADALEQVRYILHACNAREILVAQDGTEAERLYNARAGVYLAINALPQAHLVEDVVVPIDRLVEYFMFIKDVATKLGLQIFVGGHIGDGNVHPVILYEKGNRQSERAAQQAFAEICRYAIRVDGSVTGEHGVGSQKVQFFREQILAHNGREVWDLMKAIKRLFDPHGIMNPGKYVTAA